MPRKCPRGLNGTCSFCRWRLKSLSWESCTGVVSQMWAPQHRLPQVPRLCGSRATVVLLQKPSLAAMKLLERKPLPKPPFCFQAILWILSIGWQGLIFHPLSYNCTSLCLQKATIRRSGRLREHSSYEIIQRSLRGSESDGEHVLSMLQEIWGRWYSYWSFLGLRFPVCKLWKYLLA